MIKKKEKRVTNLELLESINRSFFRIEGKMATKEDVQVIIEKEVAGLKDQLAGTNKRIDDFAETKVSKITFKGLEGRVSVVEKKLEVEK